MENLGCNKYVDGLKFRRQLMCVDIDIENMIKIYGLKLIIDTFEEFDVDEENLNLAIAFGEARFTILQLRRDELKRYIHLAISNAEEFGSLLNIIIKNNNIDIKLEAQAIIDLVSHTNQFEVNNDIEMDILDEENLYNSQNIILEISQKLN